MTTARSKQIADALGIKNPANDGACTTCHAPLKAVPEPQQGPTFKASEGVSCESCHGPAENWLRAHTRKDWTHEDRAAAGMRDLKNLYVRANTCVACHQTVSYPLLKAGHPELIFELDGQSVSEPKHWREATNQNPAQMWLIGQAVALREMSWQLSHEPDDELISRWRALLWLIQKLDGLDPSLPKFRDLPDEASQTNIDTVLKRSDELAKSLTNVNWTEVIRLRALQSLVATAEDFRMPATGARAAARKAERLVLGLDRLLIGRQRPTAASQQLDVLFARAQSIPDFNPVQFGTALKKLSELIADQSNAN